MSEQHTPEYKILVREREFTDEEGVARTLYVWQLGVASELSDPPAFMPIIESAHWSRTRDGAKTDAENFFFTLRSAHIDFDWQ